MTARTRLVGCGVAVAVALVVAGCGLAVAISSLPSGDPSRRGLPGRRDLPCSRTRVVRELEAQLDSVENRFGSEHIGSRGRIDRCEAGQTLRLHLPATGRPGHGRPGAVRSRASRLGEALLDGDCADGTATDRALAEAVVTRDSSTRLAVPAACGGFSPRIMRWLSVPPTPDDVQLAEIYLRSAAGRRR